MVKMIKKENKSKLNKETKILIILFVLAFTLRIFLTTCYYWDELVYLQHADILSGKVDNYNEFEFRPPLLSIIIFELYLIWHNPLIANLFVSFLAALSVVFIYLAAKEMFNKRVGLIAALLLTFWQVHIYFSKTLLVHTTAMLFALIFLFLIKKAENNPKSWLFFSAGVFLSLAIITRFTYLVLLPIVLINIILFWKKYNLKRILAFVLGGVIILSPYLIWAYLNYGNPLHTFEMARLITDWSSKEPWHFYLSTIPVILGVVGILGLFLWLFYTIKNKKVGKQEILLILWILLPLFYLSLMPHKEIRFLLITLPPIVMFSSIGFRTLYEKIENKKTLSKIFLISLSVVILISANLPYNPYPRTCNSDPQLASAWIMNNTAQTDVIYTQEEFPALAYYTDRRIILAPFDKTRFLDTKNEYMNQPGYYVYFEMQNKTESFPKIEELNKDPRLKLIKTLNNIDKIYLYQYTPLN